MAALQISVRSAISPRLVYQTRVFSRFPWPAVVPRLRIRRLRPFPNSHVLDSCLAPLACVISYSDAPVSVITELFPISFGKEREPCYICKERWQRLGIIVGPPLLLLQITKGKNMKKFRNYKIIYGKSSISLEELSALVVKQ